MNQFMSVNAIDAGSALQRWPRSLALTCATVCLTSVLAWLLVVAGFPSPQSLSVLFVIPVLAAAVLYGFPYAALAVVLSVLAYNLVLLPPLWHIGIFEPENLPKMLVLAFVAIVASALAGRVRKLAKEAHRREQVLSGMYALSQDMLGIANRSEMRRAVESKLSSLLGAEVTILLKDVEAMNEGQPQKDMLHLPLETKDSIVGTLTVARSIEEFFPPTLLATLTAQTASALEKARLAEESENARRNEEREKFLSALLSSVSHDFKTPLVTVIGALSSLKERREIQQHDDSREMVGVALEEAQKLNRFITNLVEISRLEARGEAIRKETVSLRDLLASALKSLQLILCEQRFVIKAPPHFPLLHVNPALMELVFLNLLENAIKYGPAKGEVKIIASCDAQGATIDIDDDGEGIPESEREAIFVKFYRAKHGDRKVAGTGLGLYICRGIVEAHGGSINAINPHDGVGACVRITLPPASLIPITIEREGEEEG